jgi:hypothetical protein
MDVWRLEIYLAGIAVGTKESSQFPVVDCVAAEL